MSARRVIVGLVVLAAACAPPARAPTGQAPFTIGGSAMQVGRHIAEVGGCNDCHTAGYPDSGGTTPEADWLKGSPIGHYGPWGTTYAPNLRLTAARMSEDEWVLALKTQEWRPPMPWYVTHQYNERDLRALYQYIRSLGDPGAPTPAALLPGQIPPPPYYDYTHGGPPEAAPAPAAAPAQPAAAPPG